MQIARLGHTMNATDSFFQKKCQAVIFSHMEMLRRGFNFGRMQVNVIHLCFYSIALS